MLGKPIKCGMRVNPPSFIMIYKLKEKTRKKVMPLRNFKSSSDVKFVAGDLSERHDLKDVPLIKIEKMLRLLQEILKGIDREKAIELVEEEFTIRLNEDLNKLPTREIQFQKQLMDSIFIKNQVGKESENFVYDKQVDFDDEKVESNWDEEEKDEKFWN